MKDILNDCIDKILNALLSMLSPVGMTMLGNSVRYIRFHRHERFSWREYIFGMVSAAFMGLLVHSIGIAFGMSVAMQSAMAGMCGYAGSKLLDDVSAWFYIYLREHSKKYVKTRNDKGGKEDEFTRCSPCLKPCHRQGDTKPK